MWLHAKRLLPRLGLAAFLVLTPKCVVCGLAYAGLFGLGAAELCGEVPAAWPAWLSVAAGGGALAVLFWPNRVRRAGSMTSWTSRSKPS